MAEPDRLLESTAQVALVCQQETLRALGADEVLVLPDGLGFVLGVAEKAAAGAPQIPMVKRPVFGFAGWPGGKGQGDSLFGDPCRPLLIRQHRLNPPR